MSPTPSQNPTDPALTAVRQAIEGWDPQVNPGLDHMLEALRNLSLRFDPCQHRAASSLCSVGLKLLEEVRYYGAVRSEAVVATVSELAHGLQAALAAPPAGALPSGPGALLGLAGESETGLSQELEEVAGRPVGQVMVRLGLMTQAQVDRVLSVQSSGDAQCKLFGEIAIALGFTNARAVDSALRMQNQARGPSMPGLMPDDPWSHDPT